MEAKAPLSLDTVIKVAFSMEGRDKLTKLMQYGSRALAFYVLSADKNSDVGKKLTNLYKTTQTSRKAFRLGKSVTYYKKLQVLVANKSLTPWQRYLQYIQNTGMFGFFIYDNMAFASKAKVINFNAEEAAKRGGVLWFCANIAGFALAITNLNGDIEKEKCIRDILASEEDEARIASLQAQLDALEQSRFKKFLAVLKVTCDLIVSSNTSGIRLAERITGTKLHDGIVGSVGCVSALTVIYNAWPNVPVKKVD
uniref:Peroxisomal biogenesis factor 11 n=1 Tax=Globisporangium ultimum (strain ATCC 200006 / CBS 805.95 / DAOM BR144) TaxID=431595 RepID=K3W8G5_GLOUD